MRYFIDAAGHHCEVRGRDSRVEVVARASDIEMEPKNKSRPIRTLVLDRHLARQLSDQLRYFADTGKWERKPECASAT